MKVYAADLAISPDMFRVYGTVDQVREPQVLITRADPSAYGQKLVLNITEGYTKILDAVTGDPVPFDSLQPGQPVYAYIGPAIALSEPPIANAILLLTDIPADFRVPDYIMVHVMDFNDEQDGGVLTAEDGSLFEITPETLFFPYLTRNIVTIHDLTPGRMALIWSNPDNDTAVKVMIFPEGGGLPEDSAPGRGPSGDAENLADGSDGLGEEENGDLRGPGGQLPAGDERSPESQLPTRDEGTDQLPPEQEPLPSAGWVEYNGDWYYLNSDGTPFTGWLDDQGTWYYLDPDSGAMHTGFLTLNGRTYYLEEDGRLLTAPRLFIPDESGALQ